MIDQRGHWRFALLGMPDVHGKLAPRLRRLLSDEGRTNLAKPEAPWAVPQALHDLGFLLGERIAAAGG